MLSVSVPLDQVRLDCSSALVFMWQIVLDEIWLLVQALPLDGRLMSASDRVQLPAEGSAFWQKSALDRLRQIIQHLHYS